MKKLVLAELALLCLITGCNGEDEILPANVTVNEQSPTSQSDTAETSSPSSFNLSYEEVNMTPLNKINLSKNRTIITSKILDHVTIEIYQSDTDKEGILASLVKNFNSYDVGKIGYSGASEVSDFTIDSVDVLSKSYIKITGSDGANSPITDYISTDSMPPKLLRIGAHTVEADIDQDGIKEIVATEGTAAETTIYKFVDKKIQAMDLNKIMNAPVVIYDSKTNTFQAEVTQGNLSRWKIEDGKLQHLS
ncbi:hypothetical protein ACFVQB_11270 [Paenibacillus sp. NPDC057886]|uniref:hypothetical protein n=1 Tax=Paenibacillus sp. NPDC057886 TaxID=3346270 RepID=UPI0036D03B48